MRILLIAVALLAAISSGCSQLRLPAIDPTGSCLLSPLPTTTGLALPGAGGEGCGCLGCLRGLGGCCLTKPGFRFPEPAFATPADPPACPRPDSSVASGAASNEPCVPSEPCTGSCQNGPRAVLLGGEIDGQCGCKLADRGKRGCILLSPQKIVAPVGGEVVLLSGVCGNDGYLQMNEKLEWMLAPDSVGNFIQVGDDDPGVIGRLAGSSERPKKHDPSFATGITSTKKTLITRGNLDPRDDVSLEKGQTWITLSSPSEGVSHVTVLAPDSECWDQRKATATIYWVDARWQFPSSVIEQAGTPVELTTRVTRSETGVPARGWKVRYEMLQPELATFAGTAGASVVEAIVDDSGNATAQLIPNPGTSGTTAVAMQVIRPGGDRDSLPSMTLGSGQTFVTWSSPQLALRAGGPEVATYDTPFQVVANVSNPGNQPATNVRVDLALPPGTRVVSADSFARVLPNGVTWEIGTIPPQTQLDLFVDLAAQSPVDLTFQARGDSLGSEDTVRVDIFRPSLAMKVEPTTDRVEAGRPVTFNIDVTNNGDRPLTNPYLTAAGDSTMIHESGGTGVENKKGSPIQPGETWRAKVIFTPNTAGRRCIKVDAFADGGQRAAQESCITAINPIPATPTLAATLEGRDRIGTGQTALIRGRVANNGAGEAKNVKVQLVFDPQLQLLAATEGADQQRIGQNMISWTVPSIPPGDSVVVEGQFNTLAPNPRTRVTMNAESAEGSRANTDFIFNILDTSAPPRGPETPRLPPAGPTPEVPGGPAPLQGAPRNIPQTAPPTGPVRSGRLQTSLFGRDNPVRVNDPIRYSLTIENDSDLRDGQVGIQFALPDGVKLERLVPLTNPELSEYQINAGVVSLPYVPNLDPGERAEYEIVLSSNQPQTFDLNVQVESLNMPGGYTESIRTVVTP